MSKPTLNQIMTDAHKYARDCRAAHASYAEAVAEGLRRAWKVEPAKAPEVVDVYYVLSGDTYPHRRELRAAGCEWQADRKVWTIGGDRADRLPKAVRYLKGIAWERVEVVG
jgi:S-formylglutathione hydrolase FrmB